MIIQGDNRDVMKTFPDEIIDLTVTSPPYDSLRDYRDSLEWDFNVFTEVAKELFRVTKPGGVVVWVVGDSVSNGSESGNSFRQALYFKEIGFNLHDTMIYEKINYVPLSHNRYEQSFEYMFILSKGKPKTFNPIKITCKQAGKLEKYGTERRQNHGKAHSMRLYKDTTYLATSEVKTAPNIFSYVTGQEKTGHPAAFPEKLAIDQILSWSNEGDTVLDCFGGSGTTAVGAIKTGRNFILIEKVESYCEMSQKRVESELSQYRMVL